LKDFYERIVAAESDQIVLKRVPAPPPVKSPVGAASKSVKAVKPARK
jgi:hypothetical protein